MFNLANVAFAVWDPLLTFLWFLDFLYLTGRWASSSGTGLLTGMTWTSGWRRWSSLWSWLISFRQMKNTIRMKSTKTETAIYRLLRLNVSMKGEEETTRILGQCTGALPRGVQNADWTVVPGVGRIPGTKVFLILHLNSPRADQFLNYEDSLGLLY